MSSVSVSGQQGSLVSSNEPDSKEHLMKVDTKIHSALVVLVDFKKSSKGRPVNTDHVAQDVKPQSAVHKTDEVSYTSHPDVSAVSEKSEDSSSMEIPLKGKVTKRKSVPLRREKLESSPKTRSAHNKLCVNFPALKKSKKPDMSDDNTTNSEASEGNTLYHDVDWEGNLDNDAQLDEFAPRRRCQSPAMAPHHTKMDVEESQMSNAGSSHSGSHNHNRFEAGEKVRVHNYNNSSWEEGVVEEIDDYEQEVLVVSNGRKEWVNINSHRISKVPKELPFEIRNFRPPIDSNVSLGSIIEQQLNCTADSKSATLAKPKSEPEPVVRRSMREGDSSLPKKDSLFFKNKKMDKLKRKRTIPKRKEVAISSKIMVPVYVPKFKENEKVLAKWSNHRMQKFPAVIRKVLGKGEYDVLFYDGFVKTITEDHIYKATEEECEKYQGTNPSKADSFIEMDEDSKEARRQRKKKTFDDYLSPKDFERPRRQFLPGESGVRRHIKQTRSVGAKRFQSKIGFPRRRRTFKPPVPAPEPPSSDPASDGFVADEDAEVEGSSAVSEEVVLEDNSAEVSTQDTEDQPQLIHEEPTLKEAILPDEPLLPEPPATELPTKTEEPIPDDPFPDERVESPVPEETPVAAKKEVEPVEDSPLLPLPSVHPKLADYGDRFLCDVPEGAAPIFIRTKDGNSHKSIIVSDRNLLPGWKKHAVFIRGKQQVFLISPEGYKINSKLDLYDFHCRTLKVPPPPVLDFIVDSKVIPILREKQREMQIPAIRYPTWKIKRGKGAPRPGAKKGGKLPPHKIKSPIKTSPTGPKAGKVRTLLPKYRYEPIPLEPPEPEKETVWNCPKEGCGKTFRKESLLQMHVKHYHASEFSALIGTAPNVVDLALARSESNYAESVKPQYLPVKRPSSKTSPHIGLSERNDSEYSSSPAQGSISPQVGSSFIDELSSVRPFPPKRPTPFNEERKSTIKTLLPTRQPTLESNESVIMDSDDFDSEDEYVKLQKQRLKKMRYDHMVPRDIRLTDHGYPMSPSFKYTKKKQPALEKLQITTDSNDSYTEEEKGSPVELTEDGVVIERLRSEEIINCTCGFREEDGLMIQCDICMCWQHGICSGIESDVDVPERYVCYICRHPYRVRSSSKYNYAVHYLTQGKLPSLSFRTRDERVIRERENLLKKCFDLTSNIHQMGNVGQSLAVKLKIAEQRNHPKLYLWAKQWGNSMKKERSGDGKTSVVPEPEAPIDFEDCRERLVKDVENDLQNLDERLNLISNQISCLEAQASGSGQSEANVAPRTVKQTVQMLMKDLKDLERLATISQQ